MAVTFNVPASPKKNVFEIDQFLGVDLTNNGTNIDEYHSPNAVNMTRYVPSKVRKRMGYSDKILFSDMKDINVALGTSEDFEEYEITEGFVKYYELLNPIQYRKRIFIQFDIECDGDVEYGVETDDGSTPLFSYVTDTKGATRTIKLSRSNPSGSDVVKMYIKPRVNGTKTPTYIKIRKVIVCEKISDTSTKEYSPCPVDKGVTIIPSPTNEPVYGCHILKHGNVNTDDVTNTNRLLGTSDSETQIVEKTYKLVDPIPKGKTIYVVGEARGQGVLRVVFGSSTRYVELEEDLTFFEVSFTAYDNLLEGESVLFAEGNNNDDYAFIKGVSAMYAYDENYRWDVSPEDKGKFLSLSDVYSISAENHSSTTEERYSGTIPENGYVTKTIILNDEVLEGNLSYVAFNIYTTSSQPVTNVTITFTDANATLCSKQYLSNFNNVKYEAVLNPDANKYVNRLRVRITGVAGANYGISISNLVLKNAESLDRYIKYASHYIFHVGNRFFLTPNDLSSFKIIGEQANRKVSSSWQLGDTIYLLDGENIFSYNLSKDSATPIGDGDGFIPTVTFGKDPEGGGTSYYDLNLLQSGFYEEFYVSREKYGETGGTKVFHLSFQNLDNDKEVKAWIMNSDGEWIERTENNNFSVDRINGIITFFNTVPYSPITGTDSVRILAYRTVEGYADRIRKCTIGTLFGVNGSSDRLFLSGNPDYPNYDWYSEQYDPSYFPDTGYSTLGIETSAIVGYAIVNNYLATFKDENEPSQSVFIRQGDLVTDSTTGIAKPQFKLINTLQGAGAIAKYSFGYLQTEPLFLTRSGIYAITAQDITGEKYGQNRSFYLNGWLTKEKNLEEAFAIIHNDMYLLAINDKIYALDGLQPIRTDKSEPYATRQYVGFYWENIPALCMWEDMQALWFGTADGRVCRFANDVDALESYNDNGEPIACCWETPDLDGKLFYKNKSFRYLAIRMMSAIRTSVRLWSMSRGAWNFIKEDVNSGIYFDFENVDFDAFSFSTDRTDKVAHSKIRVKKVDKARFKIENTNVNEPFGLTNLALEYVESGNYKG